MADIHQTGKKGEILAMAHLRENGYEILESNWRSNHQEIDIIAKKNRILVVVEVKTRSSSRYGEPESFVSKAKQKHLIKAANHYLFQNHLNMEVRFDIISIVVTQEGPRITHIENAFRPTI